MQKILILGANGYLGLSICYALRKAGYFIIGVGKSSSSCENTDKYLQLDLANTDCIKVFNSLEYDTVIDLVSYVLPNDKIISMKDVRGVLSAYTQIINSCFVDKRYIFISSGGTVYGRENQSCFEDQPLKPLTPYALQKAYQEDIIQKHIKNGLILRLSNPFGGQQVVKNGVGFIAQALKCLIEQKTLDIYVPLSTIRDYIHIESFIEVVIFFIRNEWGHQVYNVSSSSGISLNEAIEILSLHYDKKIIHREDLSSFNSSLFIPKNVLDNGRLVEYTKVIPKTLHDIFLKPYNS